MPTHSRLRLCSLIILICCIALTAASGCVSDMEVHSSYAPSESLQPVPKTYDWAQLSKEQTDSWTQRTEMREFVHAAIEERFTAKGYAKQTDLQPGFLVRLHTTKEARTDSGVNPHGEVYEKIALIMDVIRPSTGRTIWRGAATARLESSANPEQRRTRINKACQMLVDTFTAGNK